MHTILLFGAGKSATVLIDYLIAEAPQNDWHVVVADVSRELVLGKTGHAARTSAVGLDIKDTAARQEWIQKADIVISLMPPALHILVADDCIKFAKHLLTASYVDDAMRAREQEIKDKGLLFLCEMGLDPGIDHMSAMQLIHRLQAEGCTISSFMSHCGGLVAPVSDDNPWRYKISWNPRNVVLAGKAGAVYKQNGVIVTKGYEELFTTDHLTDIDETVQALSFYPNRDSLPYIDIYGLGDAHTFIRTTLRYRDFMSGWRNLVELRLTDETIMYDTAGMTLGQFFQQHFAAYGYDKIVQAKIEAKLAIAQETMDKLQQAGASIEAGEDIAGKLGALTIAVQQMQQVDVTIRQLFYLGANGDKTLINKGLCSAADILQFALEQRLMLRPEDKDMVVMQHDIIYQRGNETFRTLSHIVVTGEDALRTAMAKTVGLPLGIAAKLILNGTIREKGLCIPITPAIYEPVLETLATAGIVFTEQESRV